jgi:hypothetical protein
MLTLILLVLGFFCFALSSFWNGPSINLVALGLAFWIFSVILAGHTNLTSIGIH